LRYSGTSLYLAKHIQRSSKFVSGLTAYAYSRYSCTLMRGLGSFEAKRRSARCGPEGPPRARGVAARQPPSLFASPPLRLSASPPIGLSASPSPPLPLSLSPSLPFSLPLLLPLPLPLSLSLSLSLPFSLCLKHVLCLKKPLINYFQ